MIIRRRKEPTHLHTHKEIIARTVQTLSELPLEIIIEIFKYLESEDLSNNIQNVSKFFREIYWGNFAESVWKDFQLFEKIQNKEIAKLHEVVNKFIKRHTVTYFNRPDLSILGKISLLSYICFITLVLYAKYQQYQVNLKLSAEKERLITLNRQEWKRFDFLNSHFKDNPSVLNYPNNPMDVLTSSMSMIAEEIIKVGARVNLNNSLSYVSRTMILFCFFALIALTYGLLVLPYLNNKKLMNKIINNLDKLKEDLSITEDNSTNFSTIFFNCINAQITLGTTRQKNLHELLKQELNYLEQEAKKYSDYFGDPKFKTTKFLAARETEKLKNKYFKNYDPIITLWWKQAANRDIKPPVIPNEDIINGMSGSLGAAPTL